jgi:hypothetical protein
MHLAPALCVTMLLLSVLQERLIHWLATSTSGNNAMVPLQQQRQDSTQETCS